MTLSFGKATRAPAHSQRLFCEKKKWAVAGVSSQWRVKKTLVIHGQNHGAGLNNALSINNRNPKK